MNRDNFPKRVCAKIDLSAVEHNFEVMHDLIDEETKICAVIKTDGYGHGAIPIAKRMEDKPYIWGFAVAAAEEADALRTAGITKPILILGYVFPEHYELLVEKEIRCAVFTEKMAQDLSDTAKRLGKEYALHIALDTGMSRIGFADNEASADAVAAIAALPNLSIEGMFTHFARADEADKSIARNALSRYLRFCDLLEARGVQIPIRHVSNSAGILELREANLNMVRAGITVYGIYPSDEMIRDKDLHPVMELISHVAYVKTLPANTPISYGGTFVTDRETTVATIPVGYGDGYPRSLSSKGYVLINGKKAPILGRVCMDQFMVDVTGLDASVGDEVVLMGKSGEAFLSVDTLSEISGRFPYEFVCDIGKRIPRVFV